TSQVPSSPHTQPSPAPLSPKAQKVLGTMNSETSSSTSKPQPLHSRREKSTASRKQNRKTREKKPRGLIEYYGRPLGFKQGGVVVPPAYDRGGPCCSRSDGKDTPRETVKRSHTLSSAAPIGAESALCEVFPTGGFSMNAKNRRETPLEIFCSNRFWARV